ncbi:MAG: SOS response-associated peptidase [Gemmataceae bacterium]|nr:SOS response-associated peptidase [Gemmataceae bacterium]
MCGRYQFVADQKDVADHFGLVGDLPALQPRYNVAPTQVVVVVGLKPDGQQRGLALLRWGLIPRWAKEPGKHPPINARAETLLEKPTFRDSFKQRRCLVPATGFYEWEKVGRRKAPHHFRLAGGGLMAFAGLWDVWAGPDGAKLATCCVVTVPANRLVEPLHDRMPAVLAREDFAAWLDPTTPVCDLQALLRPYPAEGMEALVVGPAVNNVRNDGPECLAPAA